MLFLADSSIWGWANSGQRPDIAERLSQRILFDQVATAPPIVLEAMHRAKNGAEYEGLFAQFFAPLQWLSLTPETGDRAVEVQRQMAQGTHGNHLRPAVDYLLAAIAETAEDDVVLWFFDKDLKIICEHTGQPYDAEDSIGPGR